MIKTAHHHHSKAVIICLSLAAMLSMAAPSFHAQDYSSFFSGNGSFEFAANDPLHWTELRYDPVVQYKTDDLTGWRLFGEYTHPTWLTGAAYDGDNYLTMSEWYGSRASFSLASIDGNLISSTPFVIGEQYELSFWAAGGIGSINALSVVIAGVGTIIDLPDNVSAPPTTSDWSRYVIPFVATDSAVSLGLSPARDGLHAGYTSSVHVDNFSIQQVPEPGSAVLAAAGGLVLMAGRRRREAR